MARARAAHLMSWLVGCRLRPPKHGAELTARILTLTYDPSPRVDIVYDSVIATQVGELRHRVSIPKVGRACELLVAGIHRHLTGWIYYRGKGNGGERAVVDGDAEIYHCTIIPHHRVSTLHPRAPF